jgi:hypothetical protein
VSNKVRETQRLTRSTSVTGPPGHADDQLLQVEPALIEQAQADIANDDLWKLSEDGPKFREILRSIVTRYLNRGGVPLARINSLKNIVAHNDEHRMRIGVRPSTSPLRVVASTAVSPAPVATTPDTIPLEPAAEPPAPVAPAVSAISSVSFDPPLTASAISAGWGFKSPGPGYRLTAEPDFPEPLPGDRSSPVWAFSAVLVWTTTHTRQIEKALRRSQTHAGTEKSDAEIEAEITKLQQRLASRRQRAGEYT